MSVGSLLVAAGVGGALVYLGYCKMHEPPPEPSPLNAPTSASQSKRIRKTPRIDDETTYHHVRAPIAELSEVLMSPSVRNRDFKLLGKERGPAGTVRYKYYLPVAHRITYSSVPLDTFQSMG